MRNLEKPELKETIHKLDKNKTGGWVNYGEGLHKPVIVSREFVSASTYKSVFFCESPVINAFLSSGVTAPVSPTSSFMVKKDIDAPGVSYGVAGGSGYWAFTGSRDFQIMTSGVINLAGVCRDLATNYGMLFDEENLQLIDAFLLAKNYLFCGDVPLDNTYEYFKEIAFEHGLRCVWDGVIKFEIIAGEVFNQILTSDTFKVENLKQIYNPVIPGKFYFEQRNLASPFSEGLVIKSTQKINQALDATALKAREGGVKYFLEGTSSNYRNVSTTGYLLAVNEFLLPGEFAGIYRQGKNLAVLGYSRFTNGVGTDVEGVAAGDLARFGGVTVSVVSVSPITLSQSMNGVALVLDNTPLSGASLAGTGITFSLVNGVIILAGGLDGETFAWVKQKVIMSREQSRSQQTSSATVKEVFYERG